MLSEVSRKFQRKGSGEYKDGPFRAFKDKKMCAICLDPESREAEERERNEGILAFPIVVFPQAEDRSSFATASHGVKEAGPSHKNPDAVGTLYLSRRDSESPHYARFVQSHFHTKPKNGKAFVLPRSLATKYAGWTDRAFRVAVDLADEAGTELAIPYKVFFQGDKNRNDVRNSGLYRKLRRFCDKGGLEMEHGVIKDFDSPTTPTVFVRRR